MSRGFTYMILIFSLISVSSFNLVQASQLPPFDVRNVDRDTILTMVVERIENKNILRISFNSDQEGKEGKFKIFDQKGNLLIQSNFELIASPYYASVDVSSLTSGNYQVTLQTEARVINSTLTIK